MKPIITRYDRFLLTWFDRAGWPRNRISKWRCSIGYLSSVSISIALLGILIFRADWLLLFALPGLIVLIPHYWLLARARKRQRMITMALPYYLDLLTLALEAGLDLVAAIEEIVERDRPHPLREELVLTLKNIQLGSTRIAAFRNMAERTGVEAIAQLATAIAQSQELGSSLGHTFRIQSEQLRQSIFRSAEELAQRAPLKMLFPLIFFIVPAIAVVLFAPILLQLTNF